MKVKVRKRNTSQAQLDALARSRGPTQITSERMPDGSLNIGRPPNFGSSLIEWVNQFARLTRAEVEEIRDDEKETLVRRRAAERVLDPDDVWTAVEHTHRKATAVNENHTEVVHVRRTVIRMPEHDRN